MKNNKKRSMGFLSLLLSATLLCSGCSSTGSVPSKSKVLKYVNEICNEKYELVSTEEVSSDPKDVRYTFKSTERELEFHADAYRQPHGIVNGGTLYYTPEIRTDYVYCVRDYYTERLDEIFASFDSQDRYDYYVYVRDTSEIDDMAEAIVKANELYQEELNFNPKEFLEDNALTTICVLAYPDENSGIQYYNLGTYYVHGSDTDKYVIKEKLLDSLAQGFTDSKVLSSAYSDIADQAFDKHVSELEHIYLDDEEMLYDIRQSEYCYSGLITYYYDYLYYDYDQQSYMVPCDCGNVADYCGSPALIISEYVNKLGGTYSIDTKNKDERSLDLKSSWTIGNSSYTMTAHYSDSNYTDVVVKKDGQDLNVTAYNLDLHTVAFTIDDFVKLFDLTYEIDEENGSVYFHSK